MRSIGVSNYDAAALAYILSFAKIHPAVNQIRYHPYNAVEQSEALAFAEEKGIVTAAYSALTPLTQMPGGPVDQVVKDVAEKNGMTEGQVILDWVKGKGILAVTLVFDRSRVGFEWRADFLIRLWMQDEWNRIQASGTA